MSIRSLLSRISPGFGKRHVNSHRGGRVLRGFRREVRKTLFEFPVLCHDSFTSTGLDLTKDLLMVTVGTRVVGPLNGEDGRTSTTPIDFITADFEFQEVLFF